MLEKYTKLLDLKDGELTEKEVNKKFKLLAKNYHPDINPTEEAHVKMKALIEARNKLLEFLQYSIITHTCDSKQEVYSKFKNSLFKIIERHFKILDGFTISQKLWPIIEEYDNVLKDKPGFGAKGGFASLFKKCGLINRVFDKKKNKYIYRKNECSISSAMKVLEKLKEEKLINYEQKGTGRGSRLRITINRDNMAKFIIDHSNMLGFKIKILGYSNDKV